MGAREDFSGQNKYIVNFRIFPWVLEHYLGLYVVSYNFYTTGVFSSNGFVKITYFFQTKCPLVVDFSLLLFSYRGRVNYITPSPSTATSPPSIE